MGAKFCPLVGVTVVKISHCGVPQCGHYLALKPANGRGGGVQVTFCWWQGQNDIQEALHAPQVRDLLNSGLLQRAVVSAGARMEAMAEDAAFGIRSDSYANDPFEEYGGGGRKRERLGGERGGGGDRRGGTGGAAGGFRDSSRGRRGAERNARGGAQSVAEEVYNTKRRRR